MVPLSQREHFLSFQLLLSGDDQVSAVWKKMISQQESTSGSSNSLTWFRKPVSTSWEIVSWKTDNCPLFICQSFSDVSPAITVVFGFFFSEDLIPKDLKPLISFMWNKKPSLHLFTWEICTAVTAFSLKNIVFYGFTKHHLSVFIIKGANALSAPLRW